MASIAAGLARNSAVHQRTNPRLYIYIKEEGEFKHQKAQKNVPTPGKNRTHDPPCSSSDALTTCVIHVMRTLDPVPLVSM